MRHWRWWLTLGILVGIVAFCLIRSDLVAGAYYWVWATVFRLPHPFTWYMRLSAQTHPFWWIVAPILVGGLVLAGYYVVIVRRGRKQGYRDPWQWELRQWVRAHPLAALLVPGGVFTAWWLLVTHLWGLI